MADSIRKQILTELRTRLEAITIDNGFVTDAGKYVFMGLLPKLGPDDPDGAIAVLPQDLTPVFQAGKVVGDWPIEVIAVANASPNRDEPWMLIEDVLADVQRAMETADRTFGGLFRDPRCFEVGATRTFDRETASEVGAISQTYQFPVQRVWGPSDVGR